MPLGDLVRRHVAERRGDLVDRRLRVRRCRRGAAPRTPARRSRRRDSPSRGRRGSSRTAASDPCGRCSRSCRPCRSTAGVGRGRGEQVRLHDVVDVAEVAAVRAVAEDHARLAADRASRDPARDHGRVRAVGILAAPEHVEVAQADDLLRRRRRGTPARRSRRRAWSPRTATAACRSDPRAWAARDDRRRPTSSTRRRRARRRRRFAATSTLRNASTLCWCDAIGSLIERGTEPSAAWCRTMSTSLHASLRDLGIAQVALDELELQPLVGVDREDVVEVALVPGQEVVDADHGLPEIEQPLEQRRADEAGDAGHEPAPRLVDQVLADLVVAGSRGHRLQSRMPRGALPGGSTLLTSITTPPSRTRA